MKLVKYSKSNNNSGSGSTSGSGGSGSSSSNNSTIISGGQLDRTIWGQYDEGDDVDGHMTVNGDVHIKCIVPPEYDDEDDEDADGEPVEEDEGGGNLDVELDVIVGRHLYINTWHSEHSGEKKCVAELIKKNSDDISTLNTKVETNITNISNNTTEINKLKSSNLTEDDVLALIRANAPSDMGSYSQPVVLFAGRGRQVTYYTNRYYFEGCQVPYFNFTNSFTDGLMTIEITPYDGYQINIFSVHCTQETAGETKDLTSTNKTGRSDGAHWFECRCDNLVGTKKVYIREFHQGNGDNDTWRSSEWSSKQDGVQQINLTMFGYVTKTTT